MVQKSKSLTTEIKFPSLDSPRIRFTNSGNDETGTKHKKPPQSGGGLEKLILILNDIPIPSHDLLVVVQATSAPRE